MEMGRHENRLHMGVRRSGNQKTHPRSSLDHSNPMQPMSILPAKLDICSILCLLFGNLSHLASAINDSITNRIRMSSSSLPQPK